MKAKKAKRWSMKHLPSATSRKQNTLHAISQGLTQKELLTLSRVLINVRDGREITFSVPVATPKIIHRAKRIESLPKALQQDIIAKINQKAFENI